MEKNKDIEEIIIFAGSLDELNRHSEHEYAIVGHFFRSSELNERHFNNIFEEAKLEIKTKGYDGIVRANLYNSDPSNSYYYFTGLPIKKLEL